METIIIGQAAKFQLVLVNADTHAPLSADFTNTTFEFSAPGIISASVDPDTRFFTVDTHTVGDVNLVIDTDASFGGVTQHKTLNVDVSVIPAPPSAELTVTRIS